MKLTNVSLFPILPTSYRLEHLRRNERRFLSDRVDLPVEIEESRPLLCADGDDFIKKYFPKFPALYEESAVNHDIVAEFTSVESVKKMFCRLEMEENAIKNEQSLSDPRGLYISEDLQQMMPPIDFNDLNQFKKPLPDLEDLEMALDAEVVEAESAQMVKLPECYFNDVFKECKTNRMLENFMNFEETKSLCKDMMPNVPSIEELFKDGFANFDNCKPRRNLDQDLEEILKTKNEDILALPAKLDIKELTSEAKAALDSELPILVGQDQQIQYRKALSL